MDHDEESLPDAPVLSPEEFLAWRSPRRGLGNPTDLTNPLWMWLVRTRLNGYRGNARYQGPSSVSAGPMWCFDRFGRSETALPDGRALLVAGEHEDYYDPDFFIYNDVVVLDPEGGAQICGYPVEAFPPTDFHSATLLPDRIVLIGNLGYAGTRAHGQTQVLTLALDDLSVRPLETRGEMPGWIHSHTAALDDEGRSIVVRGGLVDRPERHPLWENIDDWALDLTRGTWTRLTRRNWPRLTFLRADGEPNLLWEIRQLLWSRSRGDHAELARELAAVAAKLGGHEPDLDLVGEVYRFDEAMIEAPQEEEDYAVRRYSLDGVVVRFTESRYHVQVMVEGELSAERLEALEQRVLERLGRLENVAWRVER